MTLLSPYHFPINTIIQSFYSNEYYILIDIKAGMAKLLNIDNNYLEDWNACNNPHFIKVPQQLKLIFK